MRKHLLCCGYSLCQGNPLSDWIQGTACGKHDVPAGLGESPMGRPAGHVLYVLTLGRTDLLDNWIAWPQNFLPSGLCLIKMSNGSISPWSCSWKPSGRLLLSPSLRPAHREGSLFHSPACASASFCALPPQLDSLICERKLHALGTSGQVSTASETQLLVRTSVNLNEFRLIKQRPQCWSFHRQARNLTQWWEFMLRSLIKTRRHSQETGRTPQTQKFFLTLLAPSLQGKLSSWNFKCTYYHEARLRGLQSPVWCVGTYIAMKYDNGILFSLKKGKFLTT